MGGQSSATQDTTNNQTNLANTNQQSSTLGSQIGATSGVQNNSQTTGQNTNQATDQFTNQANNQLQTNGQTQAQTSSTNPWSAALPTVQGLLGQLNPLVANSGTTPAMTNAFNQLQSSYSQGNPYAAQINGLTGNLFNGAGAASQNGAIASNLSNYQQQLTPYANGSMVGNNTALQNQLSTIQNDVGNSINSQFAAAGRDMSGANQQAYGRGVAQGEAPVIANQYNHDVANQLGAAGSLYGAGNTTAGMLNNTNQQLLANQQQGLGNVTSALDANNYGANQSLNLAQLQQQLPAQNLGMLAQIGIPLAGLGSNTSSTGAANGVTNTAGNTTGTATGNTIGSTNGVTNGVTTNNTNSARNTSSLAQALANLYGSQSGTGHTSGTNTMSGAQQFGTIAQGIGAMMPKGPITFGGGG